MLKSLLCSLLLIVTSNTAIAIASTPLSSKTYDGNLETVYQSHSFEHIGNTMFSILFWDLYKSKLLTTTGEYPIDTSEKLIYEIEYLQGISSDDLIGRTVDEWEHLGLAPTSYQAYLPVLKEIWPDIKAGDSLTMLMDQSGTVFYHNQTYVGVIEGAEFGPLFLDIWLAENTSQPDLRDELLGDKR